MNILSKSAKVLTVLSLGFLSTNSFAADACNDAMGHVGTEHKVQVSSSGGNNQYQGLGKISGTSWGFEEWYEAGTNSMSYWITERLRPHGVALTTISPEWAFSIMGELITVRSILRWTISTLSLALLNMGISVFMGGLQTPKWSTIS